jgi:lysophospholipase L1-like esterase
VTYQEGVDWEYRDGLLRLLPGSQATPVTLEQLYPAAEIPGQVQPRTGGGWLYFAEGHVFHDRQLAVTYEHAPNAWTGPVSRHAAAQLPKTLAKLAAGQPLKLVLYGDSIAAGANASAVTGAPPFQPSWGQLTADALHARYGSLVTFANPSVGGMTSQWGRENVHALVTAENPDLVIVAFGMNDGNAGGFTPETFAANIQAIADDVAAGRPDCEFIMVAPMLPNPDWAFALRQGEYVTELNKMAGAGRAVADMTAVHAKLIERKRYADMTGNHVNHPNDFLIRWYFHTVAGLLLPDPPSMAHASSSKSFR